MTSSTLVTSRLQLEEALFHSFPFDHPSFCQASTASICLRLIDSTLDIPLHVITSHRRRLCQQHRRCRHRFCYRLCHRQLSIAVVIELRYRFRQYRHHHWHHRCLQHVTASVRRQRRHGIIVFAVVIIIVVVIVVVVIVVVVVVIIVIVIITVVVVS